MNTVTKQLWYVYNGLFEEANHFLVNYFIILLLKEWFFVLLCIWATVTWNNFLQTYSSKYLRSIDSIYLLLYRGLLLVAATSLSRIRGTFEIVRLSVDIYVIISNLPTFVIYCM